MNRRNLPDDDEPLTTFANIWRFDQLVAYLRDEMDGPIEGNSFDDLTFEYDPDELGIYAAVGLPRRTP